MKRLPLRLALLEAARTLEEAGVASPRTDAELIAAHVLGVERGRLPLVPLVDPRRDAGRPTTGSAAAVTEAEPPLPPQWRCSPWFMVRPGTPRRMVPKLVDVEPRHPTRSARALIEDVASELLATTSITAG